MCERQRPRGCMSLMCDLPCCCLVPHVLICVRCESAGWRLSEIVVVEVFVGVAAPGGCLVLVPFVGGALVACIFCGNVVVNGDGCSVTWCILRPGYVLCVGWVGWVSRLEQRVVSLVKEVPPPPPGSHVLPFPFAFLFSSSFSN